MKLVAPQFNIGLDSQGQIDWPPLALANETLSIDRLSIEDGRATLTDAPASRGWCSINCGSRVEVRSLTGPIRGKGEFVTGGGLYGYDISAGRAGGGRHAAEVQFEDRRAAADRRGRRACGVRARRAAVRWRAHAVAAGWRSAGGRQSRCVRAVAADQQGQGRRVGCGAGRGVVPVRAGRASGGARRLGRVQVRRAAAIAGHARRRGRSISIGCWQHPKCRDACRLQRCKASGRCSAALCGRRGRSSSRSTSTR